MAVEETNRGVFEDKVTKNIFATEYIYNNFNTLPINSINCVISEYVPIL